MATSIRFWSGRKKGAFLTWSFHYTIVRRELTTFAHCILQAWHSPPPSPRPPPPPPPPPRPHWLFAAASSAFLSEGWSDVCNWSTWIIPMLWMEEAPPPPKNGRIMMACRPVTRTSRQTNAGFGNYGAASMKRLKLFNIINCLQDHTKKTNHLLRVNKRGMVASEETQVQNLNFSHLALWHLRKKNLWLFIALISQQFRLKKNLSVVPT